MFDSPEGGGWQIFEGWVTILRIIGDHPRDGCLPSIAMVTWSQFYEVGLGAKFQVFLLVDFGWWVTILGIVGDHPRYGG